MAHPVFALWLLDRLGSCGTKEALIGDVLEEIAQGRSRFWVWRQVVVTCGFAAARCVRNRAPQTARLIAVSLALCLLGGAWIAPSARLLETWIAVYYLTGTCSLFADMLWPRSVSPGAIVAAEQRGS